MTGTASVFIRLSGCNLRCRFCDTPYASWAPEGETCSIAELVNSVSGFSARHVVITGGEPMLFPAVVPFTETLAQRGYHITIETAGTRFLPVACHLMSISPKLRNSTPSTEHPPRWAVEHERRRFCPAVVRKLVTAYAYQIKFVIDQPEDLAEVEEYLAAIPEIGRNRVLLMPQGKDPEELHAKALWLEPLCIGRGYSFCPRMQFEWYGAVRGR